MTQTKQIESNQGEKRKKSMWDGSLTFFSCVPPKILKKVFKFIRNFIFYWFEWKQDLPWLFFFFLIKWRDKVEPFSLKGFYLLAVYCVALEVLTILIVFVYNGNSIDVDIRKHLFTMRVVTDLNRLPREVVDAPAASVEEVFEQNP